MDTNKSLCQYLQHALMVEPYGQIRPCCRFDTSLYTEDFRPTQGQSFLDFYQNGPYARLREQMLAGELIMGCHRCHQEERLGLKSMRQKDFPADLNEKGSLAFVEIGVGRVCNLKCRSCDASFSTAWLEEAKALGIPHAPEDWQFDLNEFPVSLLSGTTALKISGGEPFLHAAFPRFLQKLRDEGYSRQMELQVYTNATIFPVASLPQLENFKKVRVHLSIDAVAEQNDYLRAPSRWPAVEKTVQKWLDWSQQNRNRSVSIACTVSVSNVLSLFDLINWAKALWPFNSPDIIFQILHDPKHQSLAGLSQITKARLAERFRELREKQADFSEIQNLNARLDRIESLFEGNDGESRGAENFLNETAKLDSLRKESFSKVFPEVYRLLRMDGLTQGRELT